MRNSAVISIQKQSVDGLERWSTDLNGLTTHTELERGMVRTVPDPPEPAALFRMTRTEIMTGFRRRSSFLETPLPSRSSKYMMWFAKAGHCISGINRDAF